MKKAFISLTLMLSLFGATSQLAYADESLGSVDTNPVQSVVEENNRQKRDVANEYWTAWVIKSKTSGGNAYGSWVRVGEARGSGNGGSLTISSTKSATHTYSGTLKVSKASLEKSVGYTFGSSFSRNASYTVSSTNPSKTYWVNCRNIYKQTNVNQQHQYMRNGKVIKTENKLVYAKQWTGFGYDWGTK